MRQLGQNRLSNEANQDYVKAIHDLGAEGDGVVTTNALAARLGVTAGSASAMVKRLAARGLVTHTPYRGASLTPAGLAAAREVIRHHRLLETFLVRELGMPWERVHAEADVLEHVISEELEALIAAKLGDPSHDPHGDPIPSAGLELDDAPTVSLAVLDAGQRGRLARVSDADPQMLVYLGARGIAPGDALEVIERQPFGGPLFVRFSSGTHALGTALTEAMFVIADHERGDRAPSTSLTTNGAHP